MHTFFWGDTLYIYISCPALRTNSTWHIIDTLRKHFLNVSFQNILIKGPDSSTATINSISKSWKDYLEAQKFETFTPEMLNVYIEVFKYAKNFPFETSLVVFWFGLILKNRNSWKDTGDDVSPLTASNLVTQCLYVLVYMMPFRKPNLNLGDSVLC